MINAIAAAGILGFAGSLHCLGMCGPLVTALESMSSPKRWSKNQWLHHSGRWLAYGILGLAAGSIGQTLAAVGFQRWTVLIAGVTMLLMALVPSMQHLGIRPIQRLSQTIRTHFSALMQSQRFAHRLILGFLHGLLPCGLVYTAVAGAMATTSALQGSLFMLVFGIATTPALVAVSRLTAWVKKRWSIGSYKYIQASMIVIAFLVLLRGANLGIPLLSPKINTPKATMECCHKPV
ncbi:MAG: sulfite exporter TauE/SafE family protein [Flavobacteriales bacterium]|jgi:sulfite exporter TauE/SafE